MTAQGRTRLQRCIVTNATVAAAIRDAGADYLLAVKANQPTIRSEIEAYFADAPADRLDHSTDLGKAHGRVEQRTVTLSGETDWLSGTRRFPDELRLPAAASIVRVAAHIELKDRCRIEARYYISSATLSAQQAANPVRGQAAASPRRQPHVPATDRSKPKSC
ncbi:hypothetical protein X744_29770 [Mesorhizobium sp. LNJC372A00]|nr:hypothetical protein X745_30935 [Mesorhizobium sp. LNJC374B00]ESY52299.1 hypothetical protein X744_29770 [Mesorhizobium sp. LNJC372A00]